MNDIRKPFKISNMPDGSVGILLFFSIMFFIVCGGLTVFSWGSVYDIPDAVLPISFIILLSLGFGTPYLIGAGMRTEVDYDGKHIYLKSFFKKSEINLEHVKSIRYWHDPGSGRNRIDGIVVEFTLYADPEETEDTVELYDVLRHDDDSSDIDKLIKGDHSSCPLLLLYDDIIGLYPDKKVEDKED